MTDRPSFKDQLEAQVKLRHLAVDKWATHHIAQTIGNPYQIFMYVVTSQLIPAGNNRPRQRYQLFKGYELISTYIQ